jgi:DNA-directed RNA polymerase specialized sigma24 family protein
MTEALTPEVVDVLVERHRRFLQFLEPRVGSWAVAEELLQAAFVKAVERASELRDCESAVAWFYRLLRNALVDFYQHRHAERRAMERHASETICECAAYGNVPPDDGAGRHGGRRHDGARDDGWRDDEQRLEAAGRDDGDARAR